MQQQVTLHATLIDRTVLMAKILQQHTQVYVVYYYRVKVRAAT